VRTAEVAAKKAGPLGDGRSKHATPGDDAKRDGNHGEYGLGVEINHCSLQYVVKLKGDLVNVA
jgi:hypothetical protein